MSFTKDGFYKQLGTYIGDNEFVLLAGGDHIKFGNGIDQIPLSNNQISTGLNADMVDNFHANELLTYFSGGQLSSNGNILSQSSTYLTVGGTTYFTYENAANIINSLSISKLSSDNDTNLTVGMTINGIPSADAIVTDLYARYTYQLLNSQTITIGETSRSFDGTADISWTLANIFGANAIGGTNNPIYYNGNAFVAISDTVGSTTKPIWLNAGVLTAGSYELKATVNDGTVNRIAWYSSTNAISSGSITTDGGYLGMVNYLSVNTAHQTSYRVYVDGSVYSTSGYWKYGSDNNYALTGAGGHFAIHTGRNNEANKLVRTDGNGYIQAGWINTTSGDMGTTSMDRIYCSNDAYIRYKTNSNFVSGLNAYWANIHVQTSSSDTQVPSFGAIRMNGTASAGTNYITGAAGRIFFGGNFHIDSLGNNATYINHYTSNNVYLVTGGGNVGIGTASPSYKLYVVGTVYSTGQPGFYNSVAAGSWSYVRLQSSNLWDIAVNSSSNGGALDFRPGGASNVGPFINTNGRLQVNNVANGSYNYDTSSMWIREYHYGGSQSDTWGNAPRLGWHWSGRVAAQIGLASNGWLYEAPLTATNFYRIVVEGSTGITWSINISGNADTVDGLHYSSFLRKDTNDSSAYQYTFSKTNDHAIQIGTIRGLAVGSCSGQYIHMYERVHIGSPSGWGSRNAPSYGLSTYGGAWLATDTGSVGIGTTSPSYKLHVNGDGYFTNTLHASAASENAYPHMAAIEVRERGRGLTGITHNYANAPRIGFHWGNRYWANLTYFDSWFRFMNETCGSYIGIVSSMHSINGYAGAYHGHSNNISGYAGEIWFGGNFHIDSQNGYHLYLNYYTSYNIYACYGGGTFYAAKGYFYVNTGGAYHTSDIRKKYDIRDVLDEDITNLFNTNNGFIRHFKWKKTNKDTYGVIAQEIQQWCPECIDINNDNNMLSVNYNVAYGKIIAALFKKVKEQDKIIKDLQKKMETL